MKARDLQVIMLSAGTRNRVQRARSIYIHCLCFETFMDLGERYETWNLESAKSLRSLPDGVTESSEGNWFSLSVS